MTPIPVEGMRANCGRIVGNPIFTAIIARFVALAERKPYLTTEEMAAALNARTRHIEFRFFKDEREKAADMFKRKAVTDLAVWRSWVSKLPCLP